ncbi:tectonic-1 isoform X1 [Lethenteron reissneri]|uniref:tectonic-1 isoform X1 n=1 Tax=Lethenteron reissneri TaxID=7753 RepID=UPI002AB798F2|nr:tectonic-1 isoform X1 [Lethenteron reissneri]
MAASIVRSVFAPSLLLLLSLSLCCFAQTTTTPSTPSTPSTQATPTSTEIPGSQTTAKGMIPCLCDLSQDGCDVSCGCDNDCTAYEREVFTSSPQDRWARVCVPTSTFFKHNTPYSLDDSRPSLACITHNDFSCRNFYPVMRNITEFDKEVLQSGVGTAFMWVEKTPEACTTRPYRVCDPIEVVFESNVRTRFSVPVPVSPTGICGRGGPVGFRMDRSVSCLRLISDLKTACTENSFLDGKIFTTFSFLKVLLNETTLHQEVDLVPVIWQDTPKNVSWTSDHCANALIKVQFNVQYNAASGYIDNVTAIIDQANLTPINSSLLQTFTVSFVSNERNIPTKRSGNPGYLWDHPLLGISNTSTRIQVHLPTDTDCDRQRRPALFGVQTLAGCTLRLDNQTNCMEIQRRVLNAWLGNGNQSYPENLTQWGDAMDLKMEAPSVPIVGLATLLEGLECDALNCTLTLSAKLDVLWSLHGSLENPQRRVVGARIIPGRTKPCNITRSVPLTLSLSLSFTDVTPPRPATPPTDDFFLPFMQGRT